MPKYMTTYVMMPKNVRQAITKILGKSLGFSSEEGSIIVRASSIDNANKITVDRGLPTRMRSPFQRNFVCHVTDIDFLKVCKKNTDSILISYSVCPTPDEFVAWEKVNEVLEQL